MEEILTYNMIFCQQFYCKTIGQESSSRDIGHYKVIAELKELAGGIPLVFDREFSYEGLLNCMIELGMKWVIRLNTGNRVAIKDEQGNRIALDIGINEKKVWKGIYYKGKIKNRYGQSTIRYNKYRSR